MKPLFLFSIFSVVSVGFALRLCHTNDFHARYPELSDFNSICSSVDSASDNCFAGIARIATVMSNTNCDMKIQVGDFVQGTVYDTVFEENIAIAGYKWAGYDLAVFGNHEFNKGPEPIYKTVMNTPLVTWLASNVNFTGAPEGFKTNEYVDYLNICWVGVLTTATLEISSPGPGTLITNETASIRRAISNCKQSKNVIAINHQGFDSDVRMCNDVKEIDLIIGGHSHTNLNDGEYPVKVTRADGSVCWVVQAWAFGRFVGVLDVSFDVEGAIKIESHSYVPLDYRIPIDSVVAAKLDVFTQLLDESIKEVVGETTKEIIGGRICRSMECELGNAVCDAVLVEAGTNQGATLCIYNGGSIRSSIEAGEVTIEDVLTAFPFGNVHAVIEIPGSGLLAALEHGLTAVDDADNSGRFPQLGGMKVVADLKGPPQKRVKSVTLDDGTMLEMDKIYKVVTNNFLAGGGDGYKWPGALSFELSGRSVNVLFQEYLAANSPYVPFLEGRLVDLSA